MNRRGQGISINMIILMVLGLLVLIVLIIMFMRQTGKTNDVVGSCVNLGGTCQPLTGTGTEAGCPPNFDRYPLGTCGAPDNGQICCLARSTPGSTQTPSTT